MKQTDGLFHKVFDEIAAKYPEIENEHWIIDIGAAKLADSPETFDVIVMPNLYGDVLSDVAAQITGSVGLAGSSNIGHDHAMFEAIHGSAPRRAGQNLANPSGLLQGAILMLQHIGQSDIAAKVQNAWLKTMEDGIHTYDVYDEETSSEKVGTKEFADAVIERLGQEPSKLEKVAYANTGAIEIPKHTRRPRAEKVLQGVDVFVDWEGTDPDTIGEKMSKGMNTDVLNLTMITNRGVKVWPNGFEETFCTDHWRCRFQAVEGKAATKADIIEVLNKAVEIGIDTIKTENLYTFDGVRGYSLGQGQ
jgi:isocitrate dehydrogenase